MILFGLLFFMGDLCFQTLPQIKSLVNAVFASLFFFVLTIAYQRSLFFMLLGVSLGFTWAALAACYSLNWTLPKEIENKPVFIKGVIASIPSVQTLGASFYFQLHEINGQALNVPSVLLALNWRGVTDRLMVGDEWQLPVKLKQIHGLQNPGGFDFEAWALQKGIRAKGYVTNGTLSWRIKHHPYFFVVTQWRQHLKEQIESQLPASDTAPWLLALILGIRSQFTESTWMILRRTGTNHLMAIAGLHIGLMAMLTEKTINALWRCWPTLALKIPSKLAARGMALIAVIFYSAMAGFSLPTERAVFMFGLSSLLLYCRRATNHWLVWSWTLVCVLLLNPLDVLTESFWLSFSTIAFIIYGMHGRIRPTGIIWHGGRIQCLIGVGLIPLSLFFFQECSFNSFLANMIAIPWLTFLILPCCLISVFFLGVYPPMTTWLLWFADENLQGLWKTLTWFSTLPDSTWTKAIPHVGLLVVTLFGVLLIWLPKGMPGRWLGFIYLLPLLFGSAAKPAKKEMWLTALDVGQGTSVIVRTRHHLLVYDAGPNYRFAPDAATSVILPYLRHFNLKKIDQLVISHGDNDHIGGSNTLLNQMPVLSLKTSVPFKFSHYKPFNANSLTCKAGDTWQWDGITFRFLSPAKESTFSGNDQSCVLLIDNGVHRALLTGDIEKKAEYQLIKTEKSWLKADILLAPHHGSKTSGLPAFIQAVQPKFVIYTTGYLNRYHFPHPAVEHTYALQHIQQLNTATTGAVTFRVGTKETSVMPSLYRQDHHRYWMTD